jgi:hypothetical protein
MRCRLSGGLLSSCRSGLPRRSARLRRALSLSLSLSLSSVLRGAPAPVIGARHLHRFVPAAVLVCLLALLALTAAPASAFTGHAFSSSFGSSGSGAGQLSLASNSGVAVNSSTHDVYVADTGNNRVDQFSSGTFVRAWGWGVADGLPAFEVCTLVCQAGLSGSGPGQFMTPAFVAVDNSGGPSAGDVYVGDTGDNLVSKFTGEGALVESWGTKGQLNGSAATGGPFTGIAGIALDTSGNLFVYDPNEGKDEQTHWFEFSQDGSAGATVNVEPTPSVSVGIGVDGAGSFYKVVSGGQVRKFDSSGSLVGPVDEEQKGDTGFAIDLARTDIYVDQGGARVQHFDSTCVPSGGNFGTPCTPADSFASGDLVGGAGVAVDSSNRTVYAADVGNQRLAVFAQGAYADVTTNPASAVASTAATLNGHLDPAGNGNIVDCHFQYVTDAAFHAHGYADPSVVSVPCAEGNSFSAPAEVHADVSGLRPATLYHFRLDVTDAQGQSEGVEETVSTLPAVKDVATSACSNVQGHSATLNGTLDPNGLDTTYRFEYGTTTAYGTTAPVPDADAGSTPGAQSVHVDVSALQSGTVYHYRLLATNTNGATPGQDETCTTPPAPSIDSATAANLTLSSADLTAKINPNGFDTTYHFEYGTTTGYGTIVPVPDADIGSGTSDVTKTQHVPGLSENTTYHWRVVATNANDTAIGPDHTFVYNTAGTGLPDNRAYEMVTPSHKNGALIGDVSFVGGDPSISADGSRVIASAIQCFAGAESCNAQSGGDGIGSPYAFTRSSSGWTTTPLAPPATRFPSNTPWENNADTGLALFSMATPPFGQDDFYVRQPDGSFLDIGPNTPPEEGARGGLGGKLGGAVQAQTTDFSHLVWNTLAKWPFDQRKAGSPTAYEYVGVGNSQPVLVGVTGGRRSEDLISTCGTTLGGSANINVPGSLSADGRTVFFTARDAGHGAPCPSGSGANAETPVPANTVYARIDGELPDAHTVAISRPSPSECGGGAGAKEVACREAAGKPAGARFEGASADGSRAFFSSTQQLTDGASEDSHGGDDAYEPGCEATVGVNGCNLYEYDFHNPAGHRLLDVSGGDVSGAGPRVQGVMALSPDGTHVYFVAKGVLTTTPNDQGQSAKDGAMNLYVFERDGAHPAGRTAFIADLPSSDSHEWSDRPGEPANVTPDGRFLVFVSHGRLTGDDTSVGGALQVFRFDAQTGALVRISIGEEGFNDNGNRSGPTPCATGSCSEDAYIAQPAFLSFSRSDSSMSDDGRFVFFSSPVALTRGALDDVQIASEEGVPVYAMNVYEWHEGHVYLISDGRDVTVNKGGAPMCSSETLSGLSSTCLLGSDASGANVFFSTADQLVPGDTNNEVDYYDARVCEPEKGNPCIPPPAGSPPPCLGEACHGIPAGTPPVPGAPTATFDGQGNVVPPPPAKAKQLTNAQKLAKALASCRKRYRHSRKRRAACERQARRAYGAAHRAKRSAGAKRSGRR